jgi:hypothetical protein
VGHTRRVALHSTLQDDWGGGIYQGRRSPSNAVYDALNALINDEGFLFKRGGSAFYSNADAGNVLLALYDDFLAAGQRTVAISSSHLYGFSGVAPVDVYSDAAFPDITPIARAASAGGVLAVPAAVGVYLYGGSLKSADYSTGTISVSNGSKSVTGVGTSWTANADAGMILDASTPASQFGVVASIDSNTTLTLRDAWSGTTIAAGGYTLRRLNFTGAFTALFPEHLASVGTPPRLILTKGSKAYFTGRGTPTTITLATDFHELPQNAQILGAIGLGDTCVLFTAAGVYTIVNMSLDPLDDFGNIQHAVSQVNRDFALWGDRGLVGGGGQIIAPGLDDVCVVGVDGSVVPITAGQDARGSWLEKIRPLYRSYVKAGYQPGLACVYRSHYVLPIMNGTSLVDLFICRMDRGAAWTRASGHAAGSAYAVRFGSATVAPKLLGLSSMSTQRINDVSGMFDPVSGNASEADASIPDCTITTRDYPTQQAHGFVQRARLRYELTDDGSGATAAPTVALAYSSDADAGAFATLTDKGLQGGGTGGAVSAGDKYSWWTVGKRRERIRFKITQTGACASFILRSLEMLTRQSGRQ